MYCGSVAACPLQITVVRGPGRAVCAVAFVACVTGDNVQHLMLCFVVDYITPAVNGHGRGTRLGTCLVQQQFVSCAVASATCVNAEK